jgi:hypothetical protein
LPVAVGVAVEFVEPLTECPGKENGKEGYQKVFSEPNKSRINSLTRKEKTTVSAVALHSSILSGGTSITYDGTSNS